VPEAFFAGSPSSAASVVESNKSVTLTFYSVLPGVLGANFKKLQIFFGGRVARFLQARYFINVLQDISPHMWGEYKSNRMEEVSRTPQWG
jgi:hypothetical protein